MCIVWTPEQTADFILYTINWLVFIIEVVTLYCTVGTESYKPDYVLSLKGYIARNLLSSATRWKQPNGARVLLVIICYDCIQ